MTPTNDGIDIRRLPDMESSFYLSVLKSMTGADPQCCVSTYRVSNVFSLADSVHALRAATPGSIKHLICSKLTGLSLQDLCLLLEAASNHTPYLHSVDFSLMGLDLCFLTYVIDFISRCSVLRRVDLQGNYFTPGTASAEARLQEEDLCKRAALTPISDVTTDGPRLLGEALRQKQNLAYLNLSHCSLSDTSALWLVKALTSEDYYRCDSAISRVHSYSGAYPAVRAARYRYSLPQRYINNALPDDLVDGGDTNKPVRRIPSELIGGRTGLALYLSHNVLSNAVCEGILPLIADQETVGAPQGERFDLDNPVITSVCFRGNHISQELTGRVAHLCAHLNRLLRENLTSRPSAGADGTTQPFSNTTPTTETEARAKASGSQLGFLVYGIEPKAAASFPVLNGLIRMADES